MHFHVVSLFPEMFGCVSEQGVTARAITKGLLKLDFFNPRDYASDRHRSVDDRPYGGGPGMVGRVEPWRAAIRNARQKLEGNLGKPIKTAYLSPQGEVLNQSQINSIALDPGWVLVAGRYEGLDERLLQTEIDQEWSIGDYVLSGGEIPAMVVIDSVTRQIPGVLGHEGSALQDSFQAGRLDCPHYTRPEIIDGMAVPAVLLSGDHQAIATWRSKQALGATWLKRPDLLVDAELSNSEKELLAQFRRENSK